MAKKKSSVPKILGEQRIYFKNGETKSIKSRIDALKKLKNSILKYEDSIYQSIHDDFRKPRLETYISEIGIVLKEINHVIKNLKKWSRAKRVPTPMEYFPSSSFIYYEPYGLVLIIAPWNYPFQLLMSPLIGALSAGNVVSLKTSEFAPSTSTMIRTIIEETFEPCYVSVFEGGIPVSRALLNEKFDYIFYTGSSEAGRIVMEAAAKNLTPVTLELGGKSPCIVDATADLETTARRIAWGKFFNCGQTCVAPDYILAEKTIKTELIELIVKQIEVFYGKDIQNSNDYARIINNKHFLRLRKLLDKKKLIYGGEIDKKNNFMGPAILDNVSLDDPVMKEEIFGPILPVIEFENVYDAVELVNSLEKPLSLYLFSNNKVIEELIINEIPFGGGCINDTVVHVGNPFLPFGGIGYSGIGNYHGEYSFRTFSHAKSILKKSASIDISLRYPPYDEKKFDFVKKFIK